MNKIEFILKECFNETQKNTLHAFQFTLLTGGSFKDKANIHELIIRSLENQINNVKPPLTDEEKLLCLAKEKEIKEYSAFEALLWKKNQIKVNNAANQKISIIMNELGCIHKKLTTANLKINNHLNKILNLANEYYSQRSKLPIWSIEKLICLKILNATYKEHNKIVFKILPLDKEFLSNDDELKSYLESDKVNPKIFSMINGLIATAQSILKVKWPIIPGNSEPKFLISSQSYIYDLSIIKNTIQNTVKKFFHVQNLLDSVYNNYNILKEDEQEHYDYIQLPFCVEYDRIFEITEKLEKKSREILKKLNKFEIENSAEKLFSNKLKELTEETYQQNAETFKKLLLSDWVALIKKHFEQDMNSFNEIMQDTFIDSNKLWMVSIIIKRMNTACHSTDEVFHLLMKRKEMLVPFSLSGEIKFQIDHYMEELNVIKLKYKEMLYRIYSKYDKYIKNATSDHFILLNYKASLIQFKSRIESMKNIYEIVPIGDEEALLDYIEKVESLFSPLGSTTIKKLRPGFLQSSLFSSEEDNPTLQECINLENEIIEVAESMIQRVGQLKKNKLKIKINSAQKEENNSCLTKETLSKDYVDLHQIKEKLEDLINAYSDHKISYDDMLNEVVKIQPAVLKKLVNYNLLLKPEEEQLDKCLSLLEKLLH